MNRHATTLKPHLKGATNMISAIYDRRSTRRFSDAPVSREDILEILQCGIKAPSSKNRQPWRYVVVQGDAKRGMIEVFRRGIAREERGEALLPQSSQHLTAAKHTVDIMAEAPVIIFVYNALGTSILEPLTPEERVNEICNVQSVSASIQNMLLAATEKGLGSLWICDIYFAYAELCEWLHGDGQLIAAVALGHPNEFPKARPRKVLEDVVAWRS